MAIYEDLIELALSLGRGKRVKRAVLGIFYAFSEIERGGGGLAYVDRDLISPCCEISDLQFWKEPADLLVKHYYHSSDHSSILSLSVINALVNNRKDILKGKASYDPLTSIPLSKDDHVLMIGYFEPLFKKLEGRVKSILLIEKDEGKEIKNLIPKKEKMRLAIVTSATLSNKTLHKYFPLLEDIPEVILMGPTTPLCPEIFKYTPITWLCGAVIKECDLLFRLVCEGKGTPAFYKQGAIEKINLRINYK